MLFTFEDALQIHHAKCEKIEVYKQANPAEAPHGLRRKNQQRPFRLAGQGFSGACNCKGRT